MPLAPVSPQRHANMAAIHSKDTKPEMVVRKYLWARGFRYRLNHPRLPGKPDIVLLRYRTCVFVNGCFWHGHKVEVPPEGDGADVRNSECCKVPKTNRPFWVGKIRRNQQRDAAVQRKLAAMGWHSLTVWECDLTPTRREQTLQSLVYTLSRIWLRDHAKPKTYRLPDDEPLTLAAEN